MSTALDLITDALYDCGALGQGEPLSDADAQMCLRRLQRMLDAWGNENLMVYALRQSTATLSAGDPNESSLSLGRPVSIDSAFVTSLQGIDTPLREINEQDYGAIPDKTVEGEPRLFVYRATYPTPAFTFYPVPDEDYQVTFEVRVPLAEGLLLTSQWSLPAGYEKVIQDNLAVDIASSFGQSSSDKTVSAAREGKAWLKRVNYKPKVMTTNLPYAPRRSNILQGE